MPFVDFIFEGLTRRGFDLILKWVAHIGAVWTVSFLIGTFIIESKLLTEFGARSAFFDDAWLWFRLCLVSNIVFLSVFCIWSHLGKLRKSKYYFSLKIATVYYLGSWIAIWMFFRPNVFLLLPNYAKIFASSVIILNSVAIFVTIYAFVSYGQRFYVFSTSDGQH